MACWSRLPLHLVAVSALLPRIILHTDFHETAAANGNEKQHGPKCALVHAEADVVSSAMRLNWNVDAVQACCRIRPFVLARWLDPIFQSVWTRTLSQDK